jgi:BAH domain
LKPKCRSIENIFIFFFSAALEEDLCGNSSGCDQADALSINKRYQIKQRELFLSRQVETLSATHIRGKCCVTLLNEEESMLSYLNKDVSAIIFFYNTLYESQIFFYLLFC